MEIMTFPVRGGPFDFGGGGGGEGGVEDSDCGRIFFPPRGTRQIFFPVKVQRKIFFPNIFGGRIFFCLS